MVNKKHILDTQLYIIKRLSTAHSKIRIPT